MTKIIKAIIFSLCLTLILSIGVLASEAEGRVPYSDHKLLEEVGDVEILPYDLYDKIDDEILNYQQEIDKYLFGEYAEMIEKQGFRVIHTIPYEDYVEVGITPYSEENARYIYNILGEDKVKVVEGAEVTILPFNVTGSPEDLDREDAQVSDGNQYDLISEPNDTRSNLDDRIIETQVEVDKYLFEEHGGKLEDQGFSVNHTSPNQDRVEIGITPYSEENANYIYDIFGEDMVSVVEGYQAQMIGVPDAEEGEVSITNEEEVSDAGFSIESLLLLGGFMIIGGALISTKKTK